MRTEYTVFVCKAVSQFTRSLIEVVRCVCARAAPQPTRFYFVKSGFYYLKYVKEYLYLFLISLSPSIFLIPLPPPFV